MSKDARYCFYVTLTSCTSEESSETMYYLMQFTLSWRWHSICYPYPVCSTSFQRNYVRILLRLSLENRELLEAVVTVQQFCQNTVSLRVQGLAAMEPIRGNCGKREQCTVDANTLGAPLPKRPRHAKH